MATPETASEALRASTPDALVATLRSAGLEALLDLPLEAARRLGLRWPEPLLTLTIRFLEPSATLSALLADATWWREVGKRRVQPVVPLGHLLAWIEEVRTDANIVATIPESARTVEAWCESKGVAEVLSLELDGVLARARADGDERPRVRGRPGATLLEVISEPTAEDTVEGMVCAQATRAMAWHRVVAEARDRVRGLAEEAQLALKAPEDPRARALFELLGHARGEVRERVWPRPRDRTRRGVLGGPFRLAAGAIHLKYTDAERLYTGGLLRAPEVTLVLRSLEAGGLDVSCSCGATPCTHALAALDDLRMTLSGAPWGYARSVIALLDEVARPLTLRVDRTIEQLVSRASLGDEEVVFGWIVLEEHGLQLVPAIQRRGKRGHWLQPRRATAADLAALPRHLLTPIDAVLLDTSVVPKSHGTAAVLGGAEALRAIERLIGHPRVWREGAWERPLEVRRVDLAVELGARPDGRIGLTVTLDAQLRAGAALLVLLGELLEGRTAWIEGDRLSVVAIDADTEMLLQLAVATNHALPADARARIEPALGALVARLPLTLGEGFRGPEIPCETRPSVRLTALESGGLHVQLAVRPVPGGVLQTPGEGPDIVIGRGPTGPLHTLRDRPRERERAELLGRALGLGGWSAGGERVESLERALGIVDILRAEADVEVEWASVRQMRLRGAAKAVKIEVGVTTQRDWFGVEGKVRLDDAELELAALVEALRRGHTYVRVGEDEWIRIDESLRAKLQPLADAAAIERGKVSLPRVSARALLPVLEEAELSEESPALRELLDRITAADALDVHTREPQVTAELRSYQREGWAWLSRLASWGAGACLADDMGLGKTLQALAALADRGPSGPQMVVAPTSVVGNWRRETAKFAPNLQAIVYREGDRREQLNRLAPNDLLLVSYGILVRDAEALASIKWATVVLDEAQAVKNAETQRARAVRSLDADWRLALTGTPIENHLGELWSLFDVISPGLLGKERDFRERFLVPIEKGKDAERRAALSRLVRPFVLRRTKGEVARDLPPRTELTLEIELSTAETKLYEDARQAAVARVSGLAKDGEQSRFQVLAEIMRLRQLACHPRLVYPDEAASSSKLETALALIDTLRREGHRALVFSQFTRHLALLRTALDEARVPYHYLDGSTAAAERERRVESFQAGEGDLFLISLKAGGVGLNLTGADYVLHLDPWWNPSVEDQATDRAHRIGQTRPVTVYRLVSKGTIEERILALHAEKRALVASVLDGTDVAASLSTEDLVDLIGEGVRMGRARRGEEGDGASGPSRPSDPPTSLLAPTSDRPARVAPRPNEAARDEAAALEAVALAGRAAKGRAAKAEAAAQAEAQAKAPRTAAAKAGAVTAAPTQSKAKSKGEAAKAAGPEVTKSKADHEPEAELPARAPSSMLGGAKAKKAKKRAPEVVLPAVLGHDPGGLAVLAEAFAEAEGEDEVVTWLVQALSGEGAVGLTASSDADDVLAVLREGVLGTPGSPDGRSVRARLRRLWAFGEAILEDEDAGAGELD